MHVFIVIKIFNNYKTAHSVLKKYTKQKDIFIFEKKMKIYILVKILDLI
jgi:hypothetical protein